MAYNRGINFFFSFGIVNNGQFKALSNFKVEITVEIKKSGGVFGYLCEVTFSDGTDLGYVHMHSHQSMLT